jgi:arylsulfatase A-like enzyme
MFTGLYLSKHATDSEHRYLKDDFYTIAELLRSYGYKTFGYSNNPWVGPDTNLHQGFDIYEVNEEGPAYSPLLKVAMRRIPNPIGAEDAGARQTNELVEKWIESCYNAKTPFFIFINYMEAHDPYGNTPYFRRYLDANISTAKAKGVNQNPIDYISGNLKMSDENFEILRALYDGDISYLDFKMNQLFDYLRQLNILDNTVLIIASDHGESFGEHHLMSHMLGVYDTLLHVPLVIRYPKLFKADSRVVRQVRTIDIFPTILDILGINWSGAEELQGRTLVQASQQRELPFAIAEQEILQDVLNELIKANPSLDISAYSRRLKAIRTNEFKYIWTSDDKYELYNIREDPGELNNLN